MQTVFILGDSSLLTVTVLTWQYVRHVDKKSVYWETLRDTLNSMDKLKLAPKGNKLSTKINGLGLGVTVFILSPLACLCLNFTTETT